MNTTYQLAEATANAYQLGRSRNASIDADSPIDGLDGLVQQTLEARRVESPDGANLHVDDLSAEDSARIAQAFFDGLAESYGLAAGEVIVHPAPRSQGGTWASTR